MYSFFKLSYSLNISPLILFNWYSLNVSGMVCILNKKGNSQEQQVAVPLVNYPRGWARGRGPGRADVCLTFRCSLDPLRLLSVAKRARGPLDTHRSVALELFRNQTHWLRCYRTTQAQVWLTDFIYC